MMTIIIGILLVFTGYVLGFAVGRLYEAGKL